MIKTPEKTLQGDRKRKLIAAAALIATALIVAAGLLLAGCAKKPGEKPGGNVSTPSETDGRTFDVNGGLPSKKAENPFLSPSSVDVTESAIYVSDATGFALYKLSPDGKSEKTVTFSSTVSKVKAEGGKVYVLFGELDGSLAIFDEDLKLEKTVKVGHTPSDLYVNGKTAYVANTFSGSVSVVDLNKGSVSGEIAVSREPYCMAAIGDDLYVGCRLQDGKATEKDLSSKVVKIDMKTGKVTKEIPLQNGATNVRGMAVTKDGKIVVTHTVARYTYPTTQLDRGWVNTNGFSIIDPADGVPTAFLLDEIESGAANPWDVVVTGEGRNLVFSIAGTSEIMTVDYDKLNSRLVRVRDGMDAQISAFAEIIDHIDFLAGVKTRLRLNGEGVRDMAVKDGKIYVCEYFTGDIAVLDEKATQVLSSISLGTQPEETPERLGETTWFSAKYTYQKWESCSSCHPYARPDGLNWDEEGDGIGTPKNTKSMVFSHRTPPVLTTGCVDTAEDNVMGTFREAFRSTVDEKIVYAVDSFLRSQLPLESPYLNEKGGFTESALRGKELFASLGCASCHPAPLYTDLKFHKSPYLGSDGTWENRDFITPTLVEIWRSAPYTYSGCESDVREVIKKFCKKELTAEQLEDLTSFILSIGTVGEDYGVEQVFCKTEQGETLICRPEKGGEIVSFTLRRQKPGTGSAKVTAKLCDPSGKTIAEKSAEIKDLFYNAETTVELGMKIPKDAQAGAFLEITFESGGREAATPYKLFVTD